MDTFTTTLKVFRAAANLTQEDLARLVGVARQTIVYIEKGEYMPSLRLAHKISRVFNTTIERIFIFNEE